MTSPPPPSGLTPSELTPSERTASAPTPRRGLRRFARRAGLGLAALVVVLTVASFGYNAATASRAAVPAGLQYVQAGDVRTRIRTWGATGPTIVLVHGAAETADTWDPVATRLAATHRVVALDLDGWGYSQRVAPYDLDHQTRQLLALLDVLHLSRPVLVGHSSGAAIVAEATLREPSRVDGIVLLDGDALATGAGERSPVRFLVVPPYRTTILRLVLGRDAVFRSFHARQCGPSCPRLDAAGVDAWRRPFQVPDAEDGLWGILDAGVPGLTIPRLEGLRDVPVRKAVVFGALDDVFDPSAARQTADRIGAPAPTIIADGHHLTMISHPQHVADAVTAVAGRGPQGPAPLRDDQAVS